MKRTLKGIAMVLAVALFVGVIGASDAAATSKRVAVCKAYKKFLEKNVSHYTVEEGDWDSRNSEKRDKCRSFIIVDLDKNGVPELVTEHEEGWKLGFLNVYTYKNGKVQYVKTKKGNKAKISVNCPAIGWYEVYECSKGHIHADWVGKNWLSGMYVGSDFSAYKMKNGRLRRYLHGSWEELPGKYRFYKNEKRITETKFNRLYAKCKAKECLHKNIARNRKKYLK